MTAGNRLRFDVEALKARAGHRAFARGQAYHHGGQVQILDLDPRRLLAQVSGSEDYRTILTGRGARIGGECSCPAFEESGFCKHMVAAALAANATDDVEPDGAGALSRIRDHLAAQGVAALVEMIVELAERDASLFRRLDMAAAAAQADDGILEARLRKAIDDATRAKDFIDYRRAPGWAAGVDAALDSLAELASGARAGVVLALVERSIARIEEAIESIDDSDGHCGELLDRARDIHVAAARTVRPEPLQLARRLFACELANEYGVFDGAAALYADMLGVEGLAEYRRLAVEAWKALPARPGGASAHGEYSRDHNRLADILDFFAERDGDVDLRIALRAKDLSSPWRYLQLAEFCLSQGRPEEALRRAEEGLWLFEDARQDERLVLFAATLLTKAGRTKDAELRLWQAFGKAPSFALYAPLSTLGAGERAVRLLENRLAEAHKPSHGLADLLVDILIQERMFAEAWAAASKYGASAGRKEALARASEATWPDKALSVYAERVDQLAERGGDPAYAEAARLIGRMAALRSAAEQADYLTALKARFARKRNLLKLLE